MSKREKGGMTEEVAEKVESTLISTEKVKRPCKSSAHRLPGEIKSYKPSGKITRHTKEVYSDGWTRWVCIHPDCGQVKFTRGMTFEEELKESGLTKRERK